jgi:hypothetical protein
MLVGYHRTNNWLLNVKDWQEIKLNIFINIELYICNKRIRFVKSGFTDRINCNNFILLLILFSIIFQSSELSRYIKHKNYAFYCEILNIVKLKEE